VAEVCLQQVIDHEYTRLIGKYGEPTLGAGRPGDRVCQLLVLALGKLGGREPNYHSDLDIVFLYEGDGQTRRPHDTRRDETTTNQHFFSTLGARIIKVVNQMGPLGRLYELDARLRPTGKSGALAVSLSGLSRYFTGGSAQLWERQALCKARVVYGEGESAERLMRIVHAAIVDPPWRSENAEQIRQMRYRMQETAGARNLKRGLGGTVDVEFIVQMLQLRHAADTPQALLPGTFDALDALHAAGRLAGDDFELLSNSYRFLRNVEARLRLMNTTARHDMPTDDHELTKLAYLLGSADRPALVADATRFAAENRRTFDRLFDAAAR